MRRPPRLAKHARGPLRGRLSPRSGHRIQRRWQRRKLRDLARRILARHYPDPSQECPF
jgi:hypothetical protein